MDSPGDVGTEEIEPITRGTNGAEFCKADLHLHTPGSNDFQKIECPSTASARTSTRDAGETLENETRDVTPEEYVSRLVEEDLDIVAITDHDSPGMYEEIREVAEDVDVEVLPGVEITTPGGGDHEIHITAIFSPDNPEGVASILGSQGLLTKEQGEAVSDGNIWEICEEVYDKGGLPILAHVDSTCGVLHEIPRNTRTRRKIMDESKVAAVEITDLETLDSEDVDQFSCIQSSDAHSLDQIGLRTTYLKMESPSFEGLRTALYDQESRIAFEEVETDYPAITGMRIDGRFFSDKELRLNSNLNCFIGGKGTGKSTAVEHIRYALDITPYKGRIQDEFQSKIEATLGDGGTIELCLQTQDGDKFVISREKGSDPELFDPSGRQVPLSIDEFKDEFFDVEMYSQRELLEVALDTSSQLELLDSYFGLEDIKSNIRDKKSHLRSNGQEILQKQDIAEDYRSELQNVEVLRENIRRLKEKGVEEYVENDDKWSQERNILRRISDSLESFDEIIADIDPNSSLESPDKPTDTPNTKLVDTAFSSLREARETASDSIEAIQSALEEEIEDIETTKDTWEKRNEQRQSELEELSDEIEEETEVDIQEYLDMKTREQELAEKERKLEAVEDEIGQLESEREQLFRELKQARDNRADARVNGVKRINSDLDEVQVKFHLRNDRDEYINWVGEKLTGSKVRQSDYEDVAEALRPHQLSSIVKERKYDKLADIGLTETGAHNFIDHQPLRDALFELELQNIKDEPKIEILESDGWKSLEEMSDGQRCTSLLSIAMIERKCPLIIDQPEDMLDNEFIYSTVVALLREMKHERQIIAVTHNANIPVLGDAELIVELQSSGNSGYFSARGSMEGKNIRQRVQQVLEGGPQAFDRRRLKYGY